MRREAIAAAVVAAAMLAAALLAGGGRAAAQEAGGCFEPRPLPGYTLAAFAGGGLGHLEGCAEGLGSRVHATGEDGAWLTLDPAADAGANAAFRARFADGAAAGTPRIVGARRRASTAAGATRYSPTASAASQRWPVSSYWPATTRAAEGGSATEARQRSPWRSPRWRNQKSIASRAPSGA